MCHGIYKKFTKSNRKEENARRPQEFFILLLLYYKSGPLSTIKLFQNENSQPLKSEECAMVIPDIVYDRSRLNTKYMVLARRLKKIFIFD